MFCYSLFGLESENAIVKLDVNKSLNIEMNNPLNQIDNLENLELNIKNVKPTIEDFKQSISISEKIMQGQTMDFKEKSQSLENAKQNLVNYNLVEIGIIDSCLSATDYQKAETVTQNIKTEFIPITAPMVNEVILSSKTKDFKIEKQIEFKADQDLILQQSKNVNQVITNSKVSEYKDDIIKKEKIQSSLLEHHSIDCKQYTSLSSEKNLELKKKPKKLSATKSFETTHNSILIQQTNARENEGEHKIKKKKKLRAMPKISTQEAVVICSIETSVKEDNFSQEKFQTNQAKQTFKPQKALQVLKVDHFDLESEQKQDLIKTDFAQQDISLKNAYQVNEIILDSNLNKFKIQDVDHSEAQVNILENKTFVNLDLVCLEKENNFNVIKDLDQQATKQLIYQQPISIDQNKGLENVKDFKEKIEEKQNAQISLLDQTIVNVNKTQLMDKELDLKEIKLSKKNASSRKQLNKIRSVSVERPQLLDKETIFKQAKLDINQANLELTLNKASSHSEIFTLENENIYNTIKLEETEASTKLDFHRPLEIGVVLSNEKDDELKIENFETRKLEIKQDALHLVTADSKCVQSEFTRSPKAGKSNVFSFQMSKSINNKIFNLIDKNAIVSMDSNLSVNIFENQPLNGLDKFEIQKEQTKKANPILDDLKSSLNVEDKILQNQVEEFKCIPDKGKRAKPKLIGQSCSLNIDFNETINTLSELVVAKQEVKPAHSEMNLVPQETLLLHEIVNDENLSKLVLESDVKNKANCDLVASMRNAIHLEQTIQEKEQQFTDIKPDKKKASQNLIMQEAVNIGENLALQKGEDLKSQELAPYKNAIKKMEIGQRSLSVVDLNKASEKEGFFEEKVDLCKGKLDIRAEEAIYVQLTSSHQKEQDLELIKHDFNKASTDLILATTMNISEMNILEKENKCRRTKSKSSNATKSLENLSALTIEQVNYQLSTGKLKDKKEKPCKATRKAIEKKVAVKDTNLQLELEHSFINDLINEEKCDLQQISQSSLCSSQAQILENESIYKIEKPKKSKALRDLSEHRQQSIQINKVNYLDTSKPLDIKSSEIKMADINVGKHNVGLQISEKISLESEKLFKEKKLQLQNAQDTNLFYLKQGLQVNEVNLTDHLKQVQIDEITAGKAHVKLIDKEALIKKDVLALDSGKEFEETIDRNKASSAFINQQSLQVFENRDNEKELLFRAEKPLKHKLYPKQFADQIGLVESTLLVNEYEGVQRNGKLLIIFK